MIHIDTVANFSNVFVLEQSVFKTKQLRSLLLKLEIDNIFIGKPGSHLDTITFIYEKLGDMYQQP